MNKKVISIIPARNGSKRFINKNIEIFCNFPLALWTFNFSQNQFVHCIKNESGILYLYDVLMNK